MYKYDVKSNVIINTETAEVIPVNEISHGMALDMLDSFSGCITAVCKHADLMEVFDSFTGVAAVFETLEVVSHVECLICAIHIKELFYSAEKRIHTYNIVASHCRCGLCSPCGADMYKHIASIEADLPISEAVKIADYICRELNDKEDK